MAKQLETALETWVRMDMSELKSWTETVGVTQTALKLTRLTSPYYNNATCNNARQWKYKQ